MRQAFPVTGKYTPEEGSFIEEQKGHRKKRNKAMDRFMTQIQL